LNKLQPICTGLFCKHIACDCDIIVVGP